MLSSDGRCKAFDARANGFVRSEGAGVVLLKPLSQAIADGDRIYALVRGSAINQDGRTSGLTVPSQQAQEEVLRAAYRDAGIDPRSVRFVEAHGTGTLVGDPIEARALGSVLAPGRSEGEPCLIGSVKTNIGHLEAAAGVAGLIKTALALKHREIPANLHFQEPNPDIPFEALRLKVPCANEPWGEGAGPEVAGVNSFGFGGSNAHIVLEEAPSRPLRRAQFPSPPSRAELVPLSARSPEALRALAGILPHVPGNRTPPEPTSPSRIFVTRRVFAARITTIGWRSSLHRATSWSRDSRPSPATRSARSRFPTALCPAKRFT